MEKTQTLKEAIAGNKVIIGKERTFKLLRKGLLTHIYLSSNCPKEVKEDVKHYAKLFSIEISELKENNEELGIMCKKPFAISVIAI
ncbi:MAG TPA: ribosomal L7Ae/L30e/S12e/Gadd45 family protein [Candidatus Nanoarchaeia archaeon]|nr:ribosomal L7Ae/L30e/S12e/Gadd45 family protein [Candidatus Nanoarchaeia archaeon]